MTYDLSDYVDVAERLRLFYAAHPEGSIASTYALVDVAGQPAWVVTATAYRSPTDPAPGVGVAQQAIPGATPYTRGSELENAQTSAWGRAIGSFGIGTDKGIATGEEVQRARDYVELPPGVRGGPAAREYVRKVSDPDRKQTPGQTRALYGHSKGLDQAGGNSFEVISGVLGHRDGYDLEALSFGDASACIDALKAAKARLSEGITRTSGPAVDDEWAAPVDPFTGEVAQ